MRIIDADALSAFVGDLRSTLHKEQSTFKAMTQSEFEIKDNMYLNFQYAIDNAPTVEITEEQAIDKLHETGWIIRHDKEMTERPQSGQVVPDTLQGWRYEEKGGADMRKGEEGEQKAEEE